PSNNPGKNCCTQPGCWFCRYWGCETIVAGNRWRPPKEDEFLKVTVWPHGCISRSTYQGRSPGNCTHLTVAVLQPQDPTWAIGRLWSVYRRGDDPIRMNYDHGTVIQIIRTPSPKQYIAVGPNELIAAQKEKTFVATAEPNSVPASPRPEVTSQGLFNRMLYAAFVSLNTSHPNLTKSCWLCYDAKPPFYEGIGVSTMFKYSKRANPRQCKWDTSRKGITLGMISGNPLITKPLPPLPPTLGLGRNLLNTKWKKPVY
uniref:ENV2 protein n=1 Tax=Zosterops lateralis melanops TaxID=1220523 RepID=A0A8D2Q0X7_ZOSLA